MLNRRFQSLLFLFILIGCWSCGKEPLPSIDTLVQEVIETPEAPKYVPQRLFKLSSFGVEPFSVNSQGMDIYNDEILFQAGVDNTDIHIISLQKPGVLGNVSFVTPSGEPCHMNNINCGNKLNSWDTFPILYLSQTSDSRSCFVLHILNDAKSYKIIQTIIYNGENHYMNNQAFDWFIDLDNGFIYTYGNVSKGSNKREIVKFNLPSLAIKDIVLTDEDVIDSFILENQSVYQGSKIIDGLLYAPIGYGNSQHPGRLIIIDLRQKAVVEDISISCGEPESIGKYKSGAIICGGGRDPFYYYVKLH